MSDETPTVQPSYRATVTLPPTFVTKSLLKSMETYLLKRSEAIRPPDAEWTDTKYEVAIVDAFGTETLGTIDDFGPSRFADSTSKIRMKLGFHSKPKRSFSVSITFHRFRLLSEIEIDYTGPGARELVRGTVDSLTNFVSTSPARTGWAYPSESVSGAAFGLTVALTALALPLLRHASVRTAIPFVCLWLIAIWYAGVGKTVVPYSTMDTSVNERRGKMWDWLAKTILGFLLVGVILATLKDKIFAALSW